MLRRLPSGLIEIASTTRTRRWSASGRGGRSRTGVALPAVSVLRDSRGTSPVGSLQRATSRRRERRLGQPRRAARAANAGGVRQRPVVLLDRFRPQRPGQLADGQRLQLLALAVRRLVLLLHA